MVFTYHSLRAPLLWSGVDLFFVLSGYLITGILLRLKTRAGSGSRGLASFYVKRARRILPPYLLFLIVVSAVFHVRWAHVWYWYAFFGANLANAFDRVAVAAMTPLWSLAVEEQFYFIWPFIVLFTPERTLKKIAVGIAIAAAFLRAAFTSVGSVGFIYCLTPFRADTLALGSFIAISERESPGWSGLHRQRALLCTVSAGVALCALSAFHSFRFTANTVFFNALGYSLVAIICSGALVYVLASGKGIVHTVLTAKPLRYLGQISYTFYLYHYGVLIIIRHHYHSAFIGFGLGFIATAAIAAVSWTVYEAPILRQPRFIQGARGEAEKAKPMPGLEPNFS
jgi:peptidoglycan/LPS O-acetylase OafA/YrhL